MKAKNRKINFKKIINRLIIFISLGVLAHIIFLLSTTDRSIILQLGNIKFRFLVVIACLVLVPWLGHALRMVLWTRFLNVRLSYREALKVAVSTDLGAALTPTLIGGGPIKLGMLLQHGISASKAGILIALGGFEDLVFYLSGIFLAFFFAHESIISILVSVRNIIISNAAIFGGVAIVILGIWVSKKLGWIKWSFSIVKLLPLKFRRGYLKFLVGLRTSIHETKETLKLILSKGKLTFLMSMTVLFIQWFAKFSILAVLLYALGVNIEFHNIYLKQWLVWLTMIFIPTPGATGGAEASFFLLFGNVIPKDVLTLVVSTWRFFTYYFIMMSAVIIFQLTTYIAYRKARKVSQSQA
ncbi:MAG: flippase-like domain-containing protein [Saprospiraceae bacterium]|nr:flippase-like domain-containing protein [Saprospiraceae bacterium]